MVLTQHEATFRQLCAAFGECDARRGGRVCLVTGAVGSGKTTLLEAFSEHVTGQAGRVLSATCSETERAFPFGVVEQLFHGAGLTGDTGLRLAATLRRAAASPAAGGVPEEGPTAPMTGEQPLTPLMHELFTALLDLARPGTLVLTVDDAHLADTASLQCLLYVVRRLRSHRMMVVLTESATLRCPHPALRAELLSQPHFSAIGLHALSGEALARMAGDRLPPEELERAVIQTVAMTGGSPLLARAVLDEESTAARDTTGGPAAGDGGTFDQAVLRCMYRHEPEVRRVAQALAVLGRPATVRLLGPLAGLTPEFARQAMLLLRTAGLVDADQLRHPRVVRAVLAGMSAEDHRQLHRRAAEVLHDQGAEPARVAGHLVDADWADASWAVTALHSAIGQALANGRPDRAEACLRLASRAGAYDERSSDLDAMLVRSRWQINPLSVGAHLDRLLDRAEAGGGPASRATLAGVPYLLWQGRARKAAELTARLGSPPTPAPADDAELEAARLLISLSNPEHFPEARAADARPSGPGAPATAHGRSLDAMALVADALLPERSGRDVVATAERLIQRYLADEGSVGLLTPPLIAMVYAGRPDLVTAWTRVLLGQPSVRHAPTWKAVLHAIRAEAAFRLGALPEAEEQARAALAELTQQAWGVAVVAPLATLVGTATEAGRFDEADQWLSRPVPTEALHTPLGLHYLAARARYHLATGRPHAAGHDLRWCGQAMAEWGMDRAGLVPWRLDLARVQLSLGNRTEAAALLREQLADHRRTDDRTRGAALRLQATTVSPSRGRALLTQAVEVLESCGDRVELARTLGDLGELSQRAGDLDGARPYFHRAHQLSQASGALLLAQRMARSASELTRCPARQKADAPDDRLSEAERRVAALAAQGHTNRQISSKLFITVSTVEQHLTRVYRKLDVKHRTDLARRLSTVRAWSPQLDA